MANSGSANIQIAGCLSFKKIKGSSKKNRELPLPAHTIPSTNSTRHQNTCFRIDGAREQGPSIDRESLLTNIGNTMKTPLLALMENQAILDFTGILNTIKHSVSKTD